MTFSQLASLIAKSEGKKSQASIGDIREILSLLVKMHKKHMKNELEFSPILELAAISLQKEIKLVKKPKKTNKKKGK